MTVVKIVRGKDGQHEKSSPDWTSLEEALAYKCNWAFVDWPGSDDDDDDEKELEWRWTWQWWLKKGKRRSNKWILSISASVILGRSILNPQVEAFAHPTQLHTCYILKTIKHCVFFMSKVFSVFLLHQGFDSKCGREIKPFNFLVTKIAVILSWQGGARRRSGTWTNKWRNYLFWWGHNCYRGIDITSSSAHKQVLWPPIC